MLYLASKSPRRHEILKYIGVDFKYIHSSFEETKDVHHPHKRVRHNSIGKATHTHAKDGIVLGMDTIGVLGSHIFEKPDDHAHAVRMLKMLSGKTHTVISGACFYNPKTDGKEYIQSETKVTFYKLSDKEIEEYIAKGNHLDKAAAYAIQEHARTFVKKIEGDFWTVIGFPVEVMRRCKNM